MRVQMTPNFAPHLSPLPLGERRLGSGRIAMTGAG